ncbi:MAG: TatD family hydrolase [Gemmatimonadaceae bacterium]|jgi:TatD DNase family protein|nr:TatD family hydrolase [Gemmatimonadaceae bacterium]
MLIDSHAHLAAEAFDPDRDAVLARARAAGVGHVVVIQSHGRTQVAQAMVAADPGMCSFTAGVHPHDADGFDAARDLEAIRAAVAAGAVAVGECGLDRHYDHAPRERQLAAFEAQLALAAELARPVVVHTREAEDDTAALVRSAAAAGVRGVLHCYTGSVQLAEVALAGDWYVSLSGIATFPKWERDDVVRLVPEDRLLVETDAPYLAPVPHRGRRNEPAFLPATVAHVARIRGTDAAALGRATARNAVRLFALPLVLPDA